MTKAKNIASLSILLLVIGLIAGLIIAGSLDLSRFIVAEEESPVLSKELSPALPGSSTFIQVAKTVKPVVVTITSERSVRLDQFQFGFPFEGDQFWNRFFGSPEREFKEQGLGSGVIISSDGYILTNNHVVTQADEITVRYNKKRYDARIMGKDQKTDLAVIKINVEEDLPYARLGDSDKLEVGEWVLAVGAPFGLEHSVTAGIISAIGRANINLADYEDFIQTDAAINPGNSGGALVNLKGEVIGINTAIASQSGAYQGVGFAIPSNMARNIMESLMEHGHVIRGWLGIMIQNVNEDLAQAMNLESTEGILVSDVMKDSPAESGGVERGDFIIKLNDEPVRETAELRNKIAATKPGTEVELTIIRKGKERKVKVKLGTLPDEDELALDVSKESGHRLGIQVEPLTDRLALEFGLDEEDGLVIVDIEPGSPADEAGLRIGDLIKEFNQKPLNNLNEYREQMDKVKKGDIVLLLIQRGESSFFAAIPIPENE